MKLQSRRNGCVRCGQDHSAPRRRKSAHRSDMHDSIIQLITAARLELKATRVVAASGLPPLALEKMDALREILDEMERELRRAIYDLQPPMLDAVA